MVGYSSRYIREIAVEPNSRLRLESDKKGTKQIRKWPNQGEFERRCPRQEVLKAEIKEACDFACAWKAWSLADSRLHCVRRHASSNWTERRHDVHALGVIWYQLITGDLGMMSIPSDWHEQLGEHGVGEDLIRLLGACIAPKADKRPASAAVLVEQINAAKVPMLELADDDMVRNAKGVKPRGAGAVTARPDKPAQRPTARPEPQAGTMRPAETSGRRETKRAPAPTGRSRAWWGLGLLGASLAVVALIVAVWYLFSGSKPRPVREVTGVVLLDGKPLEAAEVIFFGEEDSKLDPAQGTTGADGKYVLARTTGKGILAGNYKVMIKKMVTPDGKVPRSFQESSEWEGRLVPVVPKNVRGRKTTALRAEVKTGANSFDFRLNSDKEDATP
jgi:hypothetical protein